MKAVVRPFAARLATLAPSATLQIAAKAAAMKAKGVDVVSLSVGEPDFDTPAHIQDAIVRAVREGYSRYTPTGGLPKVREVIARHASSRLGMAYDPSEVVVTSGSKAGLFNLALALYEPGDEVIIPAPYWVSYPEQVRFVGASPVFLPSSADDDFRVDPAALRELITPRTKALILCAPSNPTGAGIADADLAGIAELAREHGFWIIADEIYTSLVYDGWVQRSILQIAPDLRDRTVVIDGLSKSYAMTGYRLGWTIAPRSLATAVDTLQSQSTSHATAVVQMAAIAALTGDQTCVEEMRRKFAERRGVMVKGLQGLPGVRCRSPHGAFYVFPDVSGLVGRRRPDGQVLESGTDVATYLLEHASVAVVPGEPFGAPDHIRLSYAAALDRIEEALRRTRAAIAELSA